MSLAGADVVRYVTTTTMRLSVTLTDAQYRALQAAARKLQIPISELLRRILDEWRMTKRKN